MSKSWWILVWSAWKLKLKTSRLNGGETNARKQRKREKEREIEVWRWKWTRWNITLHWLYLLKFFSRKRLAIWNHRTAAILWYQELADCVVVSRKTWYQGKRPWWIGPITWPISRVTGDSSWGLIHGNIPPPPLICWNQAVNFLFVFAVVHFSIMSLWIPGRDGKLIDAPPRGRC